MLWMLQPLGLLFEILKILLMLRSWPSPEAFQHALDATLWRQSPLECYANFLLEVRTSSWCYALGLILGFPTRFCCYALSISQLSPGPVRQALDATLLAVCLWELPTRSWCVLSSNTFSLPCPGTCQHALDATPLASLEAWRAIFASFCDALN